MMAAKGEAVHHNTHQRLFFKTAGNASARAAHADYFILGDMKAALRRHLNAALIECAALSRELTQVDPDGVMIDLRAEFDPHEETAPIQDIFTDGFHTALDIVKECGGEPLAARKELPSGAALG